MSDGMAESACAVLVFLRSNQTMVIPQADEGTALRTVMFVAQTFLRFPATARPPGVWLVTRDGVETTVSDHGVGSEAVSVALAAIDPRAIEGIQFVPRAVRPAGSEEVS